MDHTEDLKGVPIRQIVSGIYGYTHGVHKGVPMYPTRILKRYG